METLSGFMATFDKDMVLHKDVNYVGTARADLIELTVRYGRLTHIELLIGGYDDDNRSLYEVPEVRRWIKLVEERWPDFLFWLTPASLWMCLLCLNPAMHSRLPDGRLQIAIDPQELIPQIAASQLAAEEVLAKAGMKKAALKGAVRQAQQNFVQMLNRKKLGDDYLVRHPNDGSIVTYERDRKSTERR